MKVLALVVGEYRAHLCKDAGLWAYVGFQNCRHRQMHSAVRRLVGDGLDVLYRDPAIQHALNRREVHVAPKFLRVIPIDAPHQRFDFIEQLVCKVFPPVRPEALKNVLEASSWRIFRKHVGRVYAV